MIVADFRKKMKVLVINASANKERSITLKLTKTFLEGLGIEASEVEFVTTIGLNINPCRSIRQDREWYF